MQKTIGELEGNVKENWVKKGMLMMYKMALCILYIRSDEQQKEQEEQ